jgi:hypothetical protein
VSTQNDYGDGSRMATFPRWTPFDHRDDQVIKLGAEVLGVSAGQVRAGARILGDFEVVLEVHPLDFS